VVQITKHQVGLYALAIYQKQAQAF